MVLSTINSDYSQKSFVILYVENYSKKWIYFYSKVSQMVWNDMLFRTINSDLSQKSFLILYVKNCSKKCIYFYP